MPGGRWPSITVPLFVSALPWWRSWENIPHCAPAEGLRMMLFSLTPLILQPEREVWKACVPGPTSRRRPFCGWLTAAWSPTRSGGFWAVRPTQPLRSSPSPFLPVVLVPLMMTALRSLLLPFLLCLSGMGGRASLSTIWPLYIQMAAGIAG